LVKKNSKIKKEIKKVLNEAELAEEEFRLLDAARLYILASSISKDVGEFENAREFTEKANQLRKRNEDQKKRSQEEKQRIKDSKRIKNFEQQLNIALEIAEIAIVEKRWRDASKKYYLAAKLAEEMGATERSKAFKNKADDLSRKMSN